MKSIVKKILIVLAVVFGLYTALLYSFVRLAIVPSFNELQTAEITEEVNRCRLIINKEIAITKGLCSDWATWDDSYAFMASPNPEFIKSNLELASLKASRTNTVIFIDNQGQVIWGKTYDLATGNEIVVPQFSPENIQKTPALYTNASMDSVRSGLMLIDGVPTIVAACPIVTSKKEGPVRGTLLMARFLSTHDISELAASLGTTFTVVPVKLAALKGGDAEITLHPYGAKLHACTALHDIFDEPSIAIIADIPTPIAAKGRMIGWFVSFSVVVAGSIMLLVTFILLRHIVLKRIEKLGRSIAELATTKNDAASKSDDELARHAEMVMSVVDKLDSAEHALHASYQRFWSAFYNAPYPIIIHTDDGRIVQVNRTWTALTGYAMADVPTINDLCRKVAANNSRALRKALELTQTPSTDEPEICDIRTSYGTDLKWTVTSYPLGRNDKGMPQVISMCVDITENLEFRRTCKESESLFLALSETIPAVTWMAELTSDAFLTYISPQVQELVGRKPDELRQSADPWHLLISPEDYRSVMEARFAALSSKGIYSGEYSVRSARGELIRVREDSRVVTTAKGPMIQGIISDAAGLLWSRAHAIAAS
jgi:PAS domain S-box-containing protein